MHPEAKEQALHGHMHGGGFGGGAISTSVSVRDADRITVNGTVSAGTGLIGVGKRRSWGVLAYDMRLPKHRSIQRHGA